MLAARFLKKGKVLQSNYPTNSRSLYKAVTGVEEVIGILNTFQILTSLILKLPGKNNQEHQAEFGQTETYNRSRLECFLFSAFFFLSLTP